MYIHICRVYFLSAHKQDFESNSMIGKTRVAATSSVAMLLFLRCLSWGSYVFISYLECTSLLISICDKKMEEIQ